MISTRRFVPETSPYPWPWNGDLTRERTAVLAINMPGGQNGQAVLTAAGAGGVTTIDVRTADRGCGHASNEAAVQAKELVVASGIDGFYGSNLEMLLRSLRIERLILVGAWLETSVHSTMRTANDMGYECLLVADACVPRDPALAVTAISMIEMSGGIFGAIGSTDNVIAALTSD